MSRAPLIGISADLSDVPANATNPAQEPLLFLPQRYCRAIQEAGGITLILPPIASRSGLRRTLHRLDGILISGGNFDIHPSYYGEKPISALGSIKKERTEFELELVDLALNQDLPLLGICGGAQAINVALGGSLYQDIATQLPNATQHEQGANRDERGHPIMIHSGTYLRKIVQKQTLEVNTTHHQAVRKIGKGLFVNATAEDGLIEGLESSSHSFVLGVQWHPEILARKDFSQRRIFSSFIAASKRPHRGI
ncbi:MAG TPA: gamma-glutamyl-gamma-aminobutyrate hydrolase family protein [Candidatus Binatia bacterium]|nr:gamma-glutamyl-gamma-aminobutyrate hydrolase family protein [Candidatus Binatia bacterium]